MTRDNPKAARRLIAEAHRTGGHKLTALEVLELGALPRRSEEQPTTEDNHDPLTRIAGWARPDEPLPRGKRGPAPKRTEQQDSAEFRRKQITKRGKLPLGAAEVRRAIGAENTARLKLAAKESGSNDLKVVAQWLHDNKKPVPHRTTIARKLGLIKHRMSKTPRF